MTATGTPPIEVPDDDREDRWRGRLRDSTDDGSPIDETVPRRREARALLGSLLRPYRTALVALALIVVVENAARLSVPLLVQRGIDHGIPPIVHGGSARTLMVIVASLCAVVVIQASSRMFFLRRSGRGRAEGTAGTAASRVSPLSTARRRVPRALHVGPGGQPLYQ